MLFDKCRLLNHELDFNITTSAGLHFNSNVNIFSFLSLLIDVCLVWLPWTIDVSSSPVSSRDIDILMRNSLNVLSHGCFCPEL